MKNKLIVLIVLTNLTGCVSTGDIEGIVDKGSKGIATIQLANTGKTLANVRKIRAKASKQRGEDMMTIISNQTVDNQAYLADKMIRAEVDIAKNTWWKGFNLGLIVGSALWFLLVIGKYVFDRYKLKPKTITY